MLSHVTFLFCICSPLCLEPFLPHLYISKFLSYLLPFSEPYISLQYGFFKSDPCRVHAVANTKIMALASWVLSVLLADTASFSLNPKKKHAWYSPRIGAASHLFVKHLARISNVHIVSSNTFQLQLSCRYVSSFLFVISGSYWASVFLHWYSFWTAGNLCDCIVCNQLGYEWDLAGRNADCSMVHY